MLADKEFERRTGGSGRLLRSGGSEGACACSRTSRFKGRKNWVVGANKTGHAPPQRQSRPRFRAGVRRFHDRRSPAIRALAAERRSKSIRGIEVGHVFKLGTKYSEPMNCVYLDEKGERQPMIMGCYGLGIGRTVAAAIEQSHDDDGIIWPMPIAPFEVVVTSVGSEADVVDAADRIYEELRQARRRRHLRRSRRTSGREVQGCRSDRLPAAHRRRREEPRQRPDRVESPLRPGKTVRSSGLGVRRDRLHRGLRPKPGDGWKCTGITSERRAAVQRQWARTEPPNQVQSAAISRYDHKSTFRSRLRLYPYGHDWS